VQNKRIKCVKYKNSYIYFEKFSRIENNEKMEHNIKFLLLADYHGQEEKIPQ